MERAQSPLEVGIREGHAVAEAAPLPDTALLGACDRSQGPLLHTAADADGAARSRRALPKIGALLHGGLFAASVLALGAFAAQRALPFVCPADASLRVGEVARRFESHYDAVFPVRTLGTNLWAAIQYTLFGEGRPGVIVGADGWLYTQEEFRGWPDAQHRVESHLATIAEVDRLLARRGTALIVALLPAKARIYPEHRAEQMPAPIHKDLYAHTRRGLLDRGVTAPDLFTALARCKGREQVFLRTDTHWTPAGARCAAADIVATVQRSGRMNPRQQVYRTEQGTIREHSGDLLRFLPLTPYFASLLPPADQVVETHTQSPAANDLLADTPAPEVVLVGTSYSADPLWNFVGFLQEGLGEDVLNLADPGRGPFAPMLDYLRDTTAPLPRLVIWEIPERYLPAESAQALDGITDEPSQAAPNAPDASR